MEKGNTQNRRNSNFGPKPKPEFDQKVVAIRRVTRVVKGGRRMSFSVTMAIGDKKGRVGVGVGKAGDTSLAIEKAINDAKKHMITVALNKDMTISQEMEVKYCASRILIKPAPGRGVVAGSAVRMLMELAGIKGVSAKILSRGKNKLNIARATMKALAEIK
jgi:small subunit ribosomal protein S5